MSDRSSRQGFLGERAESIFREVRVGVVGLGGGGSHVVQQLAHLGFENFALFDPDQVETTNLNRLVGATLRDAADSRSKLAVAERVIRSLSEHPTIDSHATRWQEAADALHRCDVVVGCLDSMTDRHELEIATRRYLIPYIDIGMTVKTMDGEAPAMSGQVLLVTPDSPCFRCLHFLRDDDLAREGQRYGDAGIRPQVVWANGILASAAVGLVVDLLTGWTRASAPFEYLLFDGNAAELRKHPLLEHLDTSKRCPHFRPDDVGPKRFAPL